MKAKLVQVVKSNYFSITPDVGGIWAFIYMSFATIRCHFNLTYHAKINDNLCNINIMIEIECTAKGIHGGSNVEVASQHIWWPYMCIVPYPLLLGSPAV